MKIKLSFSLLFFFTLAQTGFSQFITVYPPQGSCAGCTNNPSSSINLTVSNSTVCFSGTGTIPTLTISASNITVYICGDITINNMSYGTFGTGTGSSVVVNAGKTLTLSNPPPTSTSPSFINYGTMNMSTLLSPLWTLNNGHIITSGASAVTNILGDMIVNGGTIQNDGGKININGLTTLISGGVYLKSNAIFNTFSLLTTGTDMVTVAPSNLACLYFTLGATVLNELTNSVLNVVRGIGASVTGSNWGVNTTVSTGGAGSCGTILPMVMGDFSVSNSGTKVIVDWSTFSEQHSDHFEIERSSDAVNFSTIGTVSASGNSASTKQYSFTDYYPSVGNDFYRIKLLSDDGNPSYSAIKEIEITPPSEMKVIVNNSQNNIKVIMPENSSQSTLRFLDMQGRIIKTVKTKTQEEFVTIETSNIFSGVYIVELITQNSHQAKQVFISSTK